MADLFKDLGLTPKEIEEFRRKAEDYTSTVDFIVSRLLPEHRGKWLFFDFKTGEYEIFTSKKKALAHSKDKGRSIVVSHIEERASGPPPTMQ
ncbi:MAG TPA: hypothetical protein VNM40_03285 [Candidatus Paceibacterota bacterium]|nr:hypothetical protein [Candidatus Paceibacterota bacterium]